MDRGQLRRGPRPGQTLDFVGVGEDATAERSFQFDVGGAMNCDLFILHHLAERMLPPRCGWPTGASHRGVGGSRSGCSGARG